jgi:hypothetical protein
MAIGTTTPEMMDEIMRVRKMVVKLLASMPMQLSPWQGREV